MTIIIPALFILGLLGLISCYAWLVHDAEQSHNRTIAILREEQARLRDRAARRAANLWR